MTALGIFSEIICRDLDQYLLVYKARTIKNKAMLITDRDGL
jgi:hypothetical protein